MATLDRPKLRPLSARRIEHEGRVYAMLHDPLGVLTHPILIPLDLFATVCRHFDGDASRKEIQARVLRETGTCPSSEQLHRLITELDQAMVLDGPAFECYRAAYRKLGQRPGALAGHAYPSDEKELRQFLDGLFAHEKGAGLPAAGTGLHRDGTRLRAIVCPHIDFRRGGPIYTWAYRRLIEESDADTFIILGVAHQYCRQRFALTTKNFETPLGLVETNREFVERLVDATTSAYYEDELVHKPEHSIEFLALFLQYLLGGVRPFKIVPILVGSFHDLMDEEAIPIDEPSIRQFIAALKTTDRALGRNSIYLGSIDLSHVGPEFGDPLPVDDEQQEVIREHDATMLRHAVSNQPEEWFQTAARISNRWRICGLAAHYTLLHAIGPAKGRLLKYDQAIDDRRECCVSFASMVFHDDADARQD